MRRREDGGNCGDGWPAFIPVHYRITGLAYQPADLPFSPPPTLEIIKVPRLRRTLCGDAMSFQLCSALRCPWTV